MIEQAVNTKAEIFSDMFRYQGGIFYNGTEHLTNELALERPSERSNHTNWLLGHIVHCRYMLANMIGVKAENPFGNIYWVAIEDREYPTVEEIVAQFPVISEMLTDRLSEMTDAELNARPAPDQPTMAEIISFFVYHEAYHIGQIGYARKMIGLEPMKSN